MNKLTRLSVLVVALCGCSCARSTGEFSAHSARGALRQALEQEVAPDRQIQEARIHVHAERSRAVPGMTYYWGTYYPPDRIDARFDAVVSGVDSSFYAVDTPEHWYTAAEHAGWRPKEALDATSACAEVARVTQNRWDPRYRAVLYEDTTSANSLWGLHAEAIQSQAHPPVVTSSDNSWRVDFWMLERGRTSKYVCRLDRGSGALSLEVGDSIKGVGLRPFGP